MLKLFISLLGLFFAWMLGQDACNIVLRPYGFLAAECLLYRIPEVVIFLDLLQAILIVLFLSMALVKRRREHWYAYAVIVAMCILMLAFERWYNTLNC